MGEEDREWLRRSFDAAAERYHRARPDYPERLFTDLEQLAGLAEGDRLLEVGTGTGKATLPLARRGYRVVGLELGPQLAAEASRNLAGFPQVTIAEASFDDWRNEGGPFDLVFAATAWHWLDPRTKYRRAWDLLTAGGHLAFWSAAHVFPENGDPFFRDIQPTYEAIGQGLPADASWPGPGELPEATGEIESSGLFHDVRLRHYDWEVRYDADSYIALLRTFSGHITMTQQQQDHLFGQVRALLARRPDHEVRRHWGAVLHVATRTPSQ